MSEQITEAQSEEPKLVEEAKPACKSRYGVVAVVVTILVLGAGHWALWNGYAGNAELRADSTEIQSLTSRLEQLEQRVQKAEGVLLLPAPVVQPVAESGATPPTPPAEGTKLSSSAQDIEKLKTGLAGLSGALGLLQGEIEKSSTASQQARQNAENGVATVLAYIELQRQVMLSRPFEEERQALRALAEGDEALIELLSKIEPVALKGAESLATLHREWRTVSHAVQSAMRKASAQTWMDRVIVALEGLVSIRSLNPQAGDTLSFAAIDMDLERGDITAASQKVAALPPEAQEQIKEWRAKLQARFDAETLSKQIASHLIMRGRAQPAVEEPVAPPPEQEPQKDRP